MSEMRILLVKTSSLGDVVHTLPALTEFAAARPGVVVDWLVEDGFAEIPGWHPAVSTVIPVEFRAWRRTPLAVLRDGRWARFVEGLRLHRYERVLDAQGLLKSAFLASRARGRRVGPDRASAREPLASLSYSARLPMPAGLHAVERLRALFAAAFDYEPAATPPGYGLDARVEALRRDVPVGDEVLLLHGTTWPTKHWPEPSWRALAARLAAEGLRVAVPWGDAAERARAERIAEAGGGEVIDRGPLAALFERMVSARGLVGVDSGLLHLAAAADTPGIALYGPTDPVRTGPWGGRVRALAPRLGCAPCLARRCRSEAPVRILGVDALEPPCLGGLAADAVADALLARLR